jgi:hypothetical protein
VEGRVDQATGFAGWVCRVPHLVADVQVGGHLAIVAASDDTSTE